MENKLILGIFKNKTQLYIALAAIAVVLIAAIIVVCVAVGGNKGGETGNEGGTSDVGGNGDNGNTDNGDNGNTDNGETGTDENNGETGTDENNGENNGENNTESGETTPAYGSAVELINKFWNAIPDYDDKGTEETFDDFLKYEMDEEGNKGYYFTGGWIVTEDWDLISVDGAAGEVMLDAEQLDSHLGYPMDKFDLVEEAASLVARNQNVLTIGAIRVAEGTNISELAEAVEANIQARMWFCGIPEKVVVLEAPGNYVISIFGQGEVDNIVAAILANIDGAKVLIDNPIM